ncbi:MAG: D-alanyl-D-alanine carboxypeptidase [Glaciihabitans sp.]|nr:D-alanyl-D-alanine carboxypeptidase [Glaciihabitans sp.]
MPTRRQQYRRRRIAVGGGAFLVLLLLGLAFYVPSTLLAPLKSIGATQQDYPIPTVAVPAMSLPGYGASGIGAVGYPGLLAQRGSSQPLPIASITKVVTALVVLQKKPLAAGKNGPAITFTAIDEQYRAQYQAEDGEVYPVQIGATLSERQVLTVMLLPSANNYARTLVDWAFGSEQKFLVAARSWLASHGLTSTTLADATGLNPHNRSTPADLVEIGKLALVNPVVSQLTALKRATVPVVGTITNTNQLLGSLGVKGIKTGTLNPFGSSLLFAADYTVGPKKITLVGVVLDGPDHPTIDSQIKKLITSVRTGFREVTLSTAGQKFGTYTTAWGTVAHATAKRTESIVVWAKTTISSKVTTASLILASRGAGAGTVVFTAGEQVVSVPLVLDHAIVDPGPWWRLTNPGALF